MSLSKQFLIFRRMVVPSALGCSPNGTASRLRKLLNFCKTTVRDSDLATALLFIRIFYCAVSVADSDVLG